MKLKTTRKRLIKMAVNRFLKSIEFSSDVEKWSFVDDFEQLFSDYLEADSIDLIKDVFNDIFKDREINVEDVVDAIVDTIDFG